MFFSFDPAKINVERIKSLAAVSQGDTVLVRYCVETKDFGDTQKIANKVLTLRFVKPSDDKSFYKKKISSAAAPDDQLVSDTLSLKGER